MPRTTGSFNRTKSTLGIKDDRSKAWTAMHVHRSFTLPQLSMTSGIRESNARDFLLRLQKYGFVRKIQENFSGRAGSHSVWLLVRYTGPDAPIAMKDGRIYDPNTKTVHGEPK